MITAILAGLYALAAWQFVLHGLMCRIKGVVQITLKNWVLEIKLKP